MKLIIALCVIGIAYGYPSWLQQDANGVKHDAKSQYYEEDIKSLLSTGKTTEKVVNKNPIESLMKLCVAIELKELFESQVIKDIDDEDEDLEKRSLLENLKAIDAAYPDTSMLPKPDNELVEDLIGELCQTIEDFLEDAYPDINIGGETGTSLKKLYALRSLEDQDM